MLNNALTNEVRIEESWLVFSLRYKRTAYFFSANRGAAAGENLPHRFPGSKHAFRHGGHGGRIPPRAEQARLVRGKEYHHRVSVCREQSDKRIKELAADLFRLKVDLIVATGPTVALAAKNATATIPIVIAGGGDPWRRIGCESGAAGRQCHRITSLSTELNTKRLEVLKDTVPKLARVGLLWTQSGDAARPTGQPGGQRPQREKLRPAALALKLKLEEIETQVDAKSLESAFQTAKQKQVGAIMTTDIRSFFAARTRIIELAGKYRLPAIHFQREFVDEGGLMSYGADLVDLYRRAAVYVDKILKGAKPADLPVQQATKFEFVINLKAAKQIGLTIPGRVLERANQVIK